MLEYLRATKVLIYRSSSNTTGKCLIIKTIKAKEKEPSTYNYQPSYTYPTLHKQLILPTCLPVQQLNWPFARACGTRRVQHAPAPTTPVVPVPDQQLRRVCKSLHVLQAVTTLLTLTVIPAATQPRAITRARAAATLRPKAAAARAPCS